METLLNEAELERGRNGIGSVKNKVETGLRVHIWKPIYARAVTIREHTCDSELLPPLWLKKQAHQKNMPGQRDSKNTLDIIKSN